MHFHEMTKCHCHPHCISLRAGFFTLEPKPLIFLSSRFSSMTACSEQGVETCRFKEFFNIYSPLQAFAINIGQLGMCTSKFQTFIAYKEYQSSEASVFST